MKDNFDSVEISGKEIVVVIIVLDGDFVFV